MFLEDVALKSAFPVPCHDGNAAEQAGEVEDHDGVLQIAKETAGNRPPRTIKAQETISVRKPKRTTEQLTTLIKERAKAFGPWPAKMTILLYPIRTLAAIAWLNRAILDTTYNRHSATP